MWYVLLDDCVFECNTFGAYWLNQKKLVWCNIIIKCTEMCYKVKLKDNVAECNTSGDILTQSTNTKTFFNAVYVYVHNICNTFIHICINTYKMIKCAEM